MQRNHFFASRLKYSRWAEVTIVPNQQVETLARTLVDHFEAMGGIPLLAVFDRPKTIALHWNKSGEVTEWNPIFAGVALDLGLGIEVCWPHAPQQKGAIENLIGWVKTSFFKQRRFLDHEDLLAQLCEWLHEVNTVRPSRATGIIPAVRRADEQPRLRPLKVTPADLALRIPVVVGATGYVLHDMHLYSTPSDAIGIAGTLFLFRERVRIRAGRSEATHTRLFTPNALSTLPEHRTERVAAVSGKRGKRYLERQHLLELGEPVHSYLTELTHRRPRRWLRDVEQLHALLQRYGAPLLRAAFEHALEQRTFGAEYIDHYLAHYGIKPSPSQTEQWTYHQLLTTLVADEITHRQQTRLARFSRRADFPLFKTIDDFNFTFQSTVRLPLLGSALSPDFVTEGRSLILYGKPGRGKTHLAVAIACRAIQNGFTALFVTASHARHRSVPASASVVSRKFLGIRTPLHPAGHRCSSSK